MLFIVFVNIFYKTNPVVQYAVQLLAKGVWYAFLIKIFTIDILFSKFGRNDYAYDRWILSPQDRKNKMKVKHKNATAALVVSIIGLILSLLFYLEGLVLSILGIVLAEKAKAQQWSKANAALLISIIGLVVGVVWAMV